MKEWCRWWGQRNTKSTGSRWQSTATLHLSEYLLFYQTLLTHHSCPLVRSFPQGPWKMSSALEDVVLRSLEELTEEFRTASGLVADWWPRISSILQLFFSPYQCSCCDLSLDCTLLAASSLSLHGMALFSNLAASTMRAAVPSRKYSCCACSFLVLPGWHAHSILLQFPRQTIPQIQRVYIHTCAWASTDPAWFHLHMYIGTWSWAEQCQSNYDNLTVPV